MHRRKRKQPARRRSREGGENSTVLEFLPPSPKDTVGRNRAAGVYLLRQASAIPGRDFGVASLRTRRELEVGAMVPLLRQCSGLGEIHRIFDRDLVAQPSAFRGERQPLDRVLL